MGIEGETVVETGSAYSVGPFDIILLLSFVGIVLYWIAKKRNEEKEKRPILNGLATLKSTRTNSTITSTPQGFVEKMKSSGKTIAVFFGSQTGTAEEFSNRLNKDSQRYGLKAGVFDPEECNFDELVDMKNDIENSLAVFVVATYGEGDPTDNSVQFHDWLKEDQSLDGLNYTVFSLGNKTYEHYQAFGRFVDKRLEELGGVRLMPIGEGDDDGNIEEDFLNWRELFWDKVCDFYDVKRDRDRLSFSVTRDFMLKTHEGLSEDEIFKGEHGRLGAYDKQRPPYDLKNPYLAPVTVNRELSKGGDRSFMHIELDISGSGIRYEAGDHVAVYPTNDVELVEKIGKILNTDLSIVMSLENMDPSASKKNPFPCPCTYRTALMHYVDITSTVKSHVLAELIKYTTDEKDLEKLNDLTSSNEKGKALYSEWIVKDHRHILSVLEDLPSCRPPLDLLLEMLPHLQVRYYSISSSPKMFKNSIHITAVVVDWETRTGRRQKGVATCWLKEKIPSHEIPVKVPMFVRHTTFRLPDKSSLPVLMVGPGTGLAPFRGFIQDRHIQKESGKELGETILYYGCRKAQEDFIYEEELKGWEISRTITDLQLAFSRDQAEKVYVTHKLKANLEQIWDVIKAGGHLYICGDAKNMAKDVHQLFIDALKLYGKKTNEQATNFLKSLGNKGRYSVDVWS